MATDVYVICFSDDQIFSKLINTFKNSELLNIYSDLIVDKRLIKEMGRHGRDLTPDLRKTGYSGHKISKLTGVNPRTINKY